MARSTMYIIIAAVVVLLVVGGYYLATKSGNSSGLYSTPTPTPTATPMPTNMQMSPTPTPSQSAAAGAVKEFTLTGNADTFSPNQLTVTKGDTVKVTFKSTDTTHTFTLPDFNVDTGDVSSGQTKTVQFVANKTGSFQFYCAIHKSMGMTGTLTVQ